MELNTVKEAVKTSLGSLYTKEDVLKLLDSIEIKSDMTDEDISTLARSIAHDLDNADILGALEVGDEEFRIVDGDRLELKDYSINHTMDFEHKVKDQVEETIKVFLNKYL